MSGFATVNSNRNNQVIALISVALLLGSPLAAMAGPQEAREAEVTNCRYVDKVEGSSGYGKKFEWRSFAKYSALKQAEQLGASHVVWESFSPVGAFNGNAVAKVYSCNS